MERDITIVLHHTRSVTGKKYAGRIPVTIKATKSHNHRGPFEVLNSG